MFEFFWHILGYLTVFFLGGIMATGLILWHESKVEPVKDITEKLRIREHITEALERGERNHVKSIKN